MTARIRDGANNELMAIETLERDGEVLVIRGKIYGAMPMTARLSPAEARALLRLLRLRLLPFLVSLPFRRG